ncbi:MAG: metal ABC transporter substrate-binding protein, partial [Lawsonibacter sp.]|nr:metal ABC transporter substrate-binding protein [Lawsonibacter sp.]
MKMKKTLSLLLASALSLSLLAGCGGAPQTPPAQSNPPAGGSSTSQGDASTPE